MRNLIVTLVAVSFVQGCASLESSIGLGASLGGAAGAGAGLMAHYNTKGMIVTAASGALIGGVLGYFLHPRPKKDEDSAELTPLSLLPNLANQDPPSLKDPSVEAVWVPDKIEGQKYEEGHRLFIIKDPAAWELKKSLEEKKNGAGKTKSIKTPKK